MNSKTSGRAEDSPFVVDNSYSLESILAEIKSSAFIDSDTSTPTEILEAEAERILREASVGVYNDEPAFEPVTENSQTVEPELLFEAEPIQPEPEVLKPPQTIIEPEIPVTVEQSHAEPETPDTAADRLINEAYERYDEPEIFRTYSDPEFSDADEVPMIVTPSEDTQPIPDSRLKSVSGTSFSSVTAAEPVKHVDNLLTVDIPIDDDDPPEIRETFSTPQDSPRSALFEQAVVPDDEVFGREPEGEELYEEPHLKDKAVKFAKQCNSISRRLWPAAIIAIIMVLITIVYEADMAVPYGIGHSLERAAGALLLMLFVVMMLCIEILLRGFDFLIKGHPNAETLVLFSCVFSALSAIFTLISGIAQMLPFCAVSALSLVFATYGERSNLRAMTDTLKTAISTAEPYGVLAEYNDSLKNSVIKKAYGRTDGFYLNLTQQDITETLFHYVTPVLLIAALFIAVINVLINGAVENSLHVLSALIAAAAPFSLLLSYSIPFSIVTKAMKKAGVALAGWGGADDIAHTDGVCVTDDDLFPTGTLRLSAVKVFDGAPQNNVLCYTASLIIASGSGLTGLFADALEEKRITPLRVIDFECHESGISALVQGHRVATGSAAYMNLIGVRVPDDSNLRNAVFTAVNGRLAAMFAIDYKPLPAVQNALISLLKWQIALYFAMRDFNITPAMVGQKFKVPFESFVFMPVKDSYSISDPYAGKQGRMSSILVRESLSPYAEAITGARLLRSASFFATILSVVSASLGLLIMALMMWSGSFLSATPGNLILYMFYMLVAVLIVCAYVRARR